MLEHGRAGHDPGPDRANCARPQAVSFLDAWRLAPRRIERPAEVLAHIRLEFRVLVSAGSVPERGAFAALDRADRKRRITVVIHAHDTLARDWGMLNLREVLERDDPMSARPHALIALPGGGAWIGELIRWVRGARLLCEHQTEGLPMPWHRRRCPAGATVQEHQWSRDPDR
jgi:hypothetical protein